MGGEEKYLVLMETSQHQGLDQEIFSDPHQMANFDLVCYVYDSSDTNSFGYIVSIRQKYASLQSLPGIVVASKSDLDRVSQRCEVQPDQYCRQLGLPSPLFVSAKEGMMADLFQKLIVAAMNPALALPVPFVNKYRRQIITGAALAGISLTLLVAASLVLRHSRQH